MQRPRLMSHAQLQLPSALRSDARALLFFDIPFSPFFRLSAAEHAMTELRIESDMPGSIFATPRRYSRPASNT